jgi:putative RecB family exonuclease
MALPLPASLSPSKVSSFKDCALAFRLSVIDRLPEPPSPHAAKGTLVHRALELLMWEEDPGQRTLGAALEKLRRAVPEVLDGLEYGGLGLSEEERGEFVADSQQLVRNYFLLEDPDQVRVIGTELRMSATVGTLKLSGIIDRLELDEAGRLIVTDYKTGRAPSASFEQPRLGGVHFYAFLCEQVLGRRPARVQLLHLREPLAISTVPSDQSIRGLQLQTAAIWAAVERACESEDFRPNPGRVCEYCGYHEYCPAVGGDLTRLVPRDAGEPPAESIRPAPITNGASAFRPRPPEGARSGAAGDARPVPAPDTRPAVARVATLW